MCIRDSHPTGKRDVGRPRRKWEMGSGTGLGLILGVLMMKFLCNFGALQMDVLTTSVTIVIKLFLLVLN